RFDATDLTDDADNLADIWISPAQQVEILRRPVEGSGPRQKQHRALEHEALAVLGNAEAVENSFDAPTFQEVLEFLVLPPCKIEQSRSIGGGNVADRALAHTIASRYGRMTLATRQILAKR